MQNKRFIHSVVILFTVLLASTKISAQSGSFGNTHIGASGEMSIINVQHNFNVGVGTQPGVISTQRTSPRGYLSFVGTASHTGSSNTAYVNGYVKSYLSTPFTFPIGQGGKLRSAGISTASVATPVDAAYFAVNPTTDGYASTSVASGVTDVSSIEYWDINGSATTQITLTWDGSSGVKTPSNVKIVGWNGSQWVNIPATIGSGATVSAGSITTSSSIIPDTYTVYTLAGLSSSIGFGGSGAGISSGTPSVSASTNETKTGNASTELVPSGGASPYVYSNGSSDAGCIAPQGAQALPASSNFTVQSNGTYTYTAPSTPGKYYYCIKVCDSSTPTAVCRVAVYTLDVAVPAGIGTLDCNKTRLLPAPIVGTPSVHLLVVTLNITSSGTFPISVSGSGMTTTTTSITATNTGSQTVSIPMNYDGTTLGVLTFNVGTSTCTADLSSATAKKKALVDVWTLDNCSVKLASPALK